MKWWLLWVLGVSASVRIARDSPIPNFDRPRPQHPPPRKLAKPYPLVEGKPAKIGAISAPQIDAPRFVINNFPKPSFATQQYPRSHLIGTENQPAPLSVFAPLDVRTNYGKEPDLTAMIQKQEEKGSGAKGKQSKKQRVLIQHPTAPGASIHPTKEARRLQHKGFRPHFVAGPGFLEFAGVGRSPMSHALLNTAAASMGPFIPRPTPPVPIRIRLTDPQKEEYENSLMTETEMRINTPETDSLAKQLVEDLQSLTKRFKSSKSDFQTQMNLLRDAVETSNGLKTKAKESFKDGELQKLRQKIQGRQQQELREAEQTVLTVSKLKELFDVPKVDPWNSKKVV